MKIKTTYRKYTRRINKMKVGHELGRKRLEKTKKTLGLSVDADLIEELKNDGVNISRLFSIIAKRYLRKKKKMGK